MRLLWASFVAAYKFISFEELIHRKAAVAEDSKAAASVDSFLNCASEVQTGKVT
jgi:hypothetical protein